MLGATCNAMTYHTMFIFHYCFVCFLGQQQDQYRSRSRTLIFVILDCFECLSINPSSYLVLEIPLGLLALDAELAGEVDLVACPELDGPVHRLLDPFHLFL